MIRSILLVVLVAVLCVAPAVADDGEKQIERQVYIFSSGGSWLGVNVGISLNRAADYLVGVVPRQTLQPE